MKKQLQIIYFLFFNLFLISCSSTIQSPIKENVKENINDKSIALSLYLKASEYENVGDLNSAIEIYLEALKYDDSEAIYFALAKNLISTENYEEGLFYSKKAHEKDSLNIEYLTIISDCFIVLQKYDSAIIANEKILKIDSTDFQASWAIAFLTEEKDPGKAISIYQKILPHATERRMDLLSRLAKLNYDTQNFQQSANYLNQILKVNPKTELKERLCDIYISLQKYDSALIHLNNLHKLDTNNLRYRFLIAEILDRTKNWKEAKIHYDYILSKDSIDYETKWWIAIAHFWQTEKDSTLLNETLNQLQICNDENPTDWRPKFFLGIANSNLNNFDKAEIYFDSVTKVASWNLDAWSNLTFLYFQKKKYNQIINLLNKAKNIFPSEYNIYYYLGLAYSQIDSHQEAIKEFEEAKKIKSDDAKLFSSLGFSLDVLKKFKDSDKAYEKAILLDSTDASTLNNYAYSLAERGINLQNALSMSLKSIQIDSVNSSFFDTLGWIYFKLNQFDESLKFINKAIKLDKNPSSVLFEHLGDVYNSQQNKTTAIEFWTKALELDPKSQSIKEKLKMEKK